MRKLLLALAILAGAAHAQVIGLTPTYLNQYFWNTSTNQFDPCPNSSTGAPFASTAQGIVLAGWNAGLMQWTPQTSCGGGSGSGLTSFQGRTTAAAVLLLSDVNTVLKTAASCNIAGGYVYSPYSNTCILGGGSFTAAGDLSGNSSSQTVVGIQGKAVVSTAPTNGQVLQWNTGLSEYVPSTLALGLNQLTGDVTAGPGTGSQVATLATVNGAPGTCGDSTHVCQITTNGKGLTTSQTQVAITGGGAVSSVSNSDSSLTVTPTTGAVVASINPAHANTWTAPQTFAGSGPPITIPANKATSPSAGTGQIGTDASGDLAGSHNGGAQSTITLQSDLVAGTNITLTPSGTTVTIAASGGGGSLPFGGTGTTNGTVNSVATLAAAVTACSTNPTTIQITIALTPNTMSVPANCALQFYDGGAINPPTGQTITINGPVSAPPNQKIFGGLGTIAGLTGEISAAWFGAVGYSTASAAAAGTDSSAIINAAYTATASGYVFIQPLYYRACALSFTKSAVGFHGFTSSYDYQTGTYNENPSALVCPSTTADIVDISGVSYTHFRDFAVIRSVLPSSGGTSRGVSVVNSLQPVLERIVSNDSIDLFYFNGSPVYANYLNGNWGFAGVTGYTNSFTMHCMNVNSVNGAAMNSAFFTNDSCSHNEAGDSGSAPNTYGSYIYGTSIQDVYFSNFNSAQMNHGTWIEYTGGTPRAPEDINFDASTHDGCETDCITVKNVTEPTSSLAGVRFNGIYAGGHHPINIINSTGVTILGSATLASIFGGNVISISGSDNISIGSGCLVSASPSGNLITVDTTTGSTISCNYKGFAGFTGNVLTVTNSTGNTFQNMAFQGVAAVGVTTDSASATTNSFGGIAIDTANITAPYSGPIASITPAFNQLLGMGGNFYALDYASGSQFGLGRGGVGGVEQWAFTSDTNHNLLIQDATHGHGILKMNAGNGFTGFTATGFTDALGWLPSYASDSNDVCALCLWSDQTLGYPAVDVGAWNSGVPGDSSGAVVAGGTILGERSTTNSTGLAFGLGGTLFSHLDSVVGSQDALTLNTRYTGAWNYENDGPVAGFRFEGVGGHGIFQLSLCDSGTAGTATAMDGNCVTQLAQSSGSGNCTWLNGKTASPDTCNYALQLNPAKNFKVDFSGNETSNSVTTANVTDSALTSGKVPLAGTGGLLGNSAITEGAAAVTIAKETIFTSSALTINSCTGGSISGNQNAFHISGITTGTTSCSVTFPSGTKAGICTANGAISGVTIASADAAGATFTIGATETDLYGICF